MSKAKGKSVEPAGTVVCPDSLIPVPTIGFVAL